MTRLVIADSGPLFSFAAGNLLHILTKFRLRITDLAGLALGTFILIFRDILSKNFLPSAGLTPVQGFSVLVAAMILTFGISGIGMIAWLVSRSSEKVTPLQLRALSSLFLAVLVLAVIVTAAALMNDRSTAARYDESVEKERFKESQINNYATVSLLSDELISSLVARCMVLRDQEIIDARLADAAVEVLTGWRDYWQLQRTFSYSDLEANLLGRLVTKGPSDDWILQEEVRNQRAIAKCIKVHVQRKLGTAPLILN